MTKILIKRIVLLAFLPVVFATAQEAAEPAKEVEGPAVAPEEAAEAKAEPPALEAEGKEAKEEPPLIQVAILLDNSGSMGGLIHQARTMIWDMVNDMANAKRDGEKPRLEVALYHYGNNPTQLKAFTDDLDGVSEALFAIGISGGHERCGEVIMKSINDLQWSDSPHDLKLIVIAGNEPFTQGEVAYTESCTEAVNKAVVVNTIHCGDWQVGVDTKWQDGALMTQGTYANINQAQQVIHVAAPQDAKLAELNKKLNGTFIAFGAAGKAMQVRQRAQDENALKQNASVYASRCVTKVGGFYCNSTWDLVDATKQKDFDWTTLKDEQLPENMRKMDAEARVKFVKGKEAERAKIQAEIKAVAKERNEFVAAERKRIMEEKGEKAEDTLDHVFRQAARKVGESRGFTF